MGRTSAFLLMGMLLGANVVGAATLRVGPGRDFATVRAAAQACGDGDVIEIDSGIYRQDVVTWNRRDLTVRGVGPTRPHLRADGVHEAGKGIWIVNGANFTVEGVEFSGASVPDQNGAAIRIDGGAGLTVRDCYIHDNENGILAGENGSSDIIVENSEFSQNGYGDGYTHNMYIGKVRSFSLIASYAHHAKIGHNVKSRAEKNYILYNRIMDENTGTSSYVIDLPNGGESYIIGNNIQQGVNTENSTIISYGAEGLISRINELYVINNTCINDRGDGQFIYTRAGATVSVLNNIFSGGGTVLSGPGSLSNNIVTDNAGLVDRGGFDYQLTDSSPAINAGTEPGVANGFSLRPTEQYVHKAQTSGRPVAGALDVGAYEYSAEGLAPSPPTGVRLLP